MYRRITHIIFALFLLISSSGITLSMHYCGGKLISSSITKKTRTCCDGDFGCCEDKTLHFEVGDDFVNPIVVENNKIVELDVLFPILSVLNFELLPTGAIAKVTFHNSSPPPITQTRLSLLQTYIC
jgi:hypothetical protein